MDRVAPRSNPTEYTNEELRRLADDAAEAALLALLPYFQDGKAQLNDIDRKMIRVNLGLLLMRKVGRPIIA